MSSSGAGANPSGGRRFVLMRTLGEGTFGTVYLADMESAAGFRRQVALKLLNPSWDPESDAGRRLRDEARLLGRLQHRNIVRVDDLIRVSGRWAMVMEYVSGADLETIFGNARAAGQELPPKAVIQVGQSVAVALRTAWEATGDHGLPLRVVHRDIKPSNIRVTDAGEVKVLDFGVARAEFAGREARTERVRYGSLGYMAPERILGEPESSAGDVYALGVVLWELLTLETLGKAGMSPDAHAELMARMEQELGTRLDPAVAGLGALVRRMLDFSPHKRPTAGEAERELRELDALAPGVDLVHFASDWLTLLGDRHPTHPDPVEGTVVEEATGPVPVAPRPAPTLVLGDDAVEVPTPPARPRTGVWVAAAVGLTLAVGVGGWALFGQGDAASAEAAASTPLGAPNNGLPAVAAGVAPPALGAPQVAEPAPAPEGPVEVAEPAPTAAPTAPPPRAAGQSPKTTAAAAPARPSPPAEPAPEPAPAAVQPVAAAPATRLRSAKFTLTGGEGLDVRCGDVSGRGTTNVLLREFPPGSCSVSAGGHSAAVTLDAPRGVTCALGAEGLSCQ